MSDENLPAIGPESNSSNQPIVFERDGGVFANSRDVAAFFGKRNADVNRAIRDLITQKPELGQRNFAPNKINDLTGDSISDYDMDRKGFTLLTMGFTGPKALDFKVAYIDQFDAMESALRNRSAGFQIPASLPEALRLAADQAEMIERQKAQLTAMAPKVDAFERIAGSEGSLCPTDAAKALQIRPKVLFDWLRAHSWIYSRTGKKNWIAYQDKIQQGLLEHKVQTYLLADGTEKIKEDVRVTPKGLAKLAKIVPGALGSSLPVAA